MTPFFLFMFCYLTALSYQQQEQVAVDRQSANISIPCNLGLQGTKPFWIINGFVYDVFSIPYAFPAIPVVKSYSSLTIPLVTTDFNGTTFQCAINTENGVIFGRSTRIKVVSNDGIIIHVQPPVFAIDLLRIQYEELEVDKEKAVIRWTFVNCSSVYELQGYTLSNIEQNLSAPDILFKVENRNVATIPSANFFTASGDPLNYRLVALDEDFSICSSTSSRGMFYRFSVSAAIETSVVAPNSTVCYEVPPFSECTSYSMEFIWPRDDPGQPCICPVLIPKPSLFESCVIACENGSIIPQLANGSICFSAPSRTETVVHFDCAYQYNCSLPSCTINALLASYRIRTAGTEMPKDETIAAVIVSLILALALLGLLILCIWIVKKRKTKRKTKTLSLN